MNNEQIFFKWKEKTSDLITEKTTTSEEAMIQNFVTAIINELEK